MQEEYKTTVFNNLKAILANYSKRLIVVQDDDHNYYLNTSHVMKNKQPLFFGAVQIKKSYVSFHLMPVYVKPELLNTISDALGKRMQGKSCFNFKEVDAELFEELAVLTHLSFQYYVGEQYLIDPKT